MVFIYKEPASPALPGDLPPSPPSAQQGEAEGEGELGGYKAVRKGVRGRKAGTRRTPPTSSTHPVFHHLFLPRLFTEHLICAQTPRDQRGGVGLTECLCHPGENVLTGGSRKTLYPCPTGAGTRRSPDMSKRSLPPSAPLGCWHRPGPKLPPPLSRQEVLSCIFPESLVLQISLGSEPECVAKSGRVRLHCLWRVERKALWGPPPTHTPEPPPHPCHVALSPWVWEA